MFPFHFYSRFNFQFWIRPNLIHAESLFKYNLDFHFPNINLYKPFFLVFHWLSFITFSEYFSWPLKTGRLVHHLRYFDDSMSCYSSLKETSKLMYLGNVIYEFKRFQKGICLFFKFANRHFAWYACLNCLLQILSRCSSFTLQYSK